MASSTPSPWEFNEHPVIYAVTAAKSQDGLSVSPLTLIDVLAAGCNCKALEDSGARIPVISKRLFEQCKGKAIGSSRVQGIIGETVDAPLVNMIIRLSGEVTSYDSVVMCAMVDINATDYDMILPTNVVNKLRSMPVVTVASLKVIDNEVIVCNEGEDLESELNDESNVVTNDDRGDVCLLYTSPSPRDS